MNQTEKKTELIKEEADRLLASLFMGAKVEVVYFQDRYLVTVTTPTKSPPENFEVIASLQHLLRSIVEKRLREWVPLEIDIDRFRKLQEDSLRKLAIQAEERVGRGGRPVYLRPMTAWERRVIHLTLQESPNVTTESIGSEPHRKVVIRRKVRHE